MKTLFSTPDERHSFVIGLCELLPPWPPHHPLHLRQELTCIVNEHHYYVFGRTCSFLLLITICSLLVIAYR